MWGHFQRRRLARREGWVGAGLGFELEAKNLVICGVVGGRKGWMPLIFHE